MFISQNIITKNTLPFYLLVSGIFLIIISPDLMSKGMFVDGLIYSTVAKNMSEGIGTFWHPHFTSTVMPEFHEHPPLALGLQSLSFTLFGEDRLVDKFYSLFLIILTGYIITLIWKSLKFKNSWIPLLFWAIIPLTGWTAVNNVHENTMSVFISLSVLFYIKSQERRKILFLLMSGIMLSLGFMTKGFNTLFPWTLPFISWLFERKNKFIVAFSETLGIVLFTVIPLLILFAIVPASWESIRKFIDIQVVPNVTFSSSPGSRFYVVARLLSELIPSLGLIIIVFLAAKRKNTGLKFISVNFRRAMIFYMVGLAGVFPIMISVKQSGFYIAPAMSFFAIGSGILVYELTESLLSRIRFESGGFKIFRWAGIIFFLTGIILCLNFRNGYSRDRDMLEDVEKIMPEIPAGSVISIDEGLYQNWSLHCYFNRFRNISLDSESAEKRDYWLVMNENRADMDHNNYSAVDLNTKLYTLFRIKQ